MDFDAFVASRGASLWRTSWLLTGDPHLAEDLLQTALAKSWPKWSSIREGGHEACVRRVLVTTYAAWWRRKWRGEHPTDQLPEG
ncbi:MAG: SigE family RNA polymerase sigma factor, partial [Nocardioides sp.]